MVAAREDGELSQESVRRSIEFQVSKGMTKTAREVWRRNGSSKPNGQREDDKTSGAHPVA